ncbi:MAG: hypothetical protein OEV78_11825 [Spirochaetia bacterium]|nr:hypothetical protein [Spirochaetia bacterium]
MKVLRKNGEFSQKMLVTQNKAETLVEFFDTAGESSLNRFSPKMESLETRYIDTNNKEYLKITFDSVSRTILSEGSIVKKYELETPVYDGNGALFYVFSKILPKSNHPYIFNLLQSKEKRMVKMYLKYVGQEKILVNGKPVESVKYETGLVSKVLSVFWPYTYNYWFSMKTHEFVKYEGPVGHNDSETIEVRELNK